MNISLNFITVPEISPGNEVTMNEMNSAPQVALIMPAYNASKYIENTLRSLQRQSFENFELIVVNDGSKDNTAEIISAIAAEDRRFRLISIENGGPANARNAAFSYVKPGTEYIMFMDADDEYKTDAIETAVNAAKSGADMVIFGFTIVNLDGTTNDYFESRMSLERKDFGASLAALYKANVLNQVWAKLFRANLILKNGLSFPDYRWGEDRLFIYDCLEHAEKIEILPDCNYLYLMHEGESLITKFYDKKLSICIEADARMRELRKTLNAPDDGAYDYMFIKAVLSCMTNLYSPSCKLSSAEKREYVRGILQNERIIEAAGSASGGAAVKALCTVLRSKSVSLNLLSAWGMTVVGKAAPKLFLKLKHKK